MSHKAFNIINYSLLKLGGFKVSPKSRQLIHLRPSGKLKVTIKASWLQGSRVDPDAMTEVSGQSMFTDRSASHPKKKKNYEEDDGVEEQVSAKHKEA